MVHLYQQVTQVFARRGYNVQSLAVGPSETQGDSRITMVVPGTLQSINKIMKQVREGNAWSYLSAAALLTGSYAAQASGACCHAPDGAQHTCCMSCLQLQLLVIVCDQCSITQDM